MNLFTGLASYFVCWWITWLAVLPFGVHPQGEEEGDIVPGTIPSAPVKPHIWRKLILTTILAFLPWLLIFSIMEYDILSFDDIPFIPEFTNN